MDYFCFHHSTTKTYNSKFEELFGDAAAAEACCSSPRRRDSRRTLATAPGNFKELCKLNQHYADIAASIQKVTEESAAEDGASICSKTPA